MTAQISHSVEARASNLLLRYLQSAERHQGGHLDDHDEMIARDAFISGFHAGYVRGGRDCLEEATALNTLVSDRRFQVALATLLQFIESEAAGR